MRTPTDQHLVTAASTGDLALLRRFEPAVRYTRGERFFPVDVLHYIDQCSLWVQRPDEEPDLLVPQGELTVEKLAQPRQDGFGAIYFLKLIEPPDLLELAKYSLNQAVKSLTQRNPEEIFRAGHGRLARVGYFSRFIDALFSFTLYMRGRVPGDAAAAAALAYQRMRLPEDPYPYYGRVVRENGWVILQYWYFYPFNNWRSGFFGINDHEGDWEMVCIYCSRLNPGDELVPQWVAFASHDFSGDDLRRRWDDPEVEKVLDDQGHLHPVIYAGAGSHASYFARGDYLTEVELAFLAPLVRLSEAVKDFWNVKLRQGSQRRPSEFNIFRVPFVDYARGDGACIGQACTRQWEVHLLDEHTEWAVHYRGLWGLYARDPISGENAPAGPVYNRDGSVRRSWYDPLGWAGLDKVPPPHERLEILERRRRDVQAECDQLRLQVDERSAELFDLGVESAALRGHPHLVTAYNAAKARIATLSQELASLRSQVTVAEARLEAFERYEAQVLVGDPGPMRAHIHRAHQPSSGMDLRWGRLAEVFAAVSIGLTMIGMVLIIMLARQYLFLGLAALIGLLIFIEAGFRRRLSQLINSLVIGLAIVSAFVLLFEFFWQIIVAAVLAAGLYIMWENMREIRS